MTSRELVSNAIRFAGIDRLPHNFPEPYGSDPTGAGHRQEAIEAMCEEFLRVSDEMYSPGSAGILPARLRASLRL
jgi:hypothetical protein